MRIQTRENIIGVLEKTVEVLSSSHELDDMHLVSETKVFLKYAHVESMLKVAVKHLFPQIFERMEKDVLQSTLTDAEIIIVDIDDIYNEMMDEE